MFIIKTHYEATETNENFKGKITNYYSGKRGRLLSENELPAKWLINEYGYSTLHGAKRGLKTASDLAEWETNEGHWNVSVELIEI